ncbi:MAG: inositol monophosphatase family protein [Candidatus Bathyarchaeia archaeon]
MEDAIELLIGIAKEIYSAIHPLLGTADAKKIVGLGFGGDKTRFIDAVAEKVVIERLEKNNFSCVFIGEEFGVRRIGSSPSFYLAVDGVDGTNNAIRGIRFASASLALSRTEYLSDLEAAVVIDLYSGEIFSAERGLGAKCNGRIIRTSKQRDLGNSIVSINITKNIEAARKLLPVIGKVKGVRAFGSAALETCHVACGLLEAYIDLRGVLRTIDFAAGMLILKEAGGVFLRSDGDDMMNVPLTEIRRFSIIASANKELLEKIVSLISS